MTARGRAALALGAATYLAGWAFGSRPLDLVAVGLLLAVFAAWLVVRFTARPVELRRSTKVVPIEGDDVQVRVELELEAARAPAGITLVERYEKLGERRTQLRTRGQAPLDALRRCPAVPRGRYRIEKTAALVEDAFGLERSERPLAEAGALIVYPRLTELERLFSETGEHARDGRRLLLQRPSGFDLHSVRDYVAGRLAPQGALAVDGAPRAVDGEGARGLSARRRRGRARRVARLSRARVRRRRARGRLDPADVRAAQPPRLVRARPAPPSRYSASRRKETGGARSSCSPAPRPTGQRHSRGCSSASGTRRRSRSTSPS